MTNLTDKLQEEVAELLGDLPAKCHRSRDVAEAKSTFEDDRSAETHGTTVPRWGVNEEECLVDVLTTSTRTHSCNLLAHTHTKAFGP